ncbi:hypothetical protein M3194_13290 [Paenibacillus glycanilyticus]|uniref:hypothetical protein n=1 Tax=Paenibacillus glycanilyticus TaxID=126569 RepID=UPI00203DC7E8|nr:hypothetical protein [Paenibacillus glycanilyticus]MCM3628341.1 hypothetical protein [Paenibacillus glycanilyticus]
MRLRLEQRDRKSYSLLHEDVELELYAIERSGFFNIEIPGLMKATPGILGGKQNRYKLENGEIYNRKEGFFIFGYMMSHLSTNFEGYEVGKGRKGHFFCIYEGEQQVALIEKDRKVINSKDTYTLFVQEPELIDIVKIFAIHWDCTSYGNRTGGNLYSKEVSFACTINKFVNSKYDPTFKSRCI